MNTKTHPPKGDVFPKTFLQNINLAALKYTFPTSSDDLCLSFCIFPSFFYDFNKNMFNKVPDLDVAGGLLRVAGETDQEHVEETPVHILTHLIQHKPGNS